MLGLTVGVVAAFVIGVLVKPRQEMNSTYVKHVLFLSLILGVVAGSIAYFTLGRRGAELVVIAGLWALLLPVLMLARVLRARLQRKSTL